MSHDLFMRRCMQLARLGAGYAAPNPLVGSVVVVDGRIVAEGYHHRYGQPHAEVMALNRLDDDQLLRRCTLYVNLEPCVHFGKTPPCTGLILSKKVGKVVIANQDPYPRVNGNGIALLRSQGVDVTTGVLEQEGNWLNRRFFTFHTRRRPYVVLKWAQSADGFMAPKGGAARYWISNPVSRQLVHLWRSREQAILAGRKTVQIDNPELNVRGIAGNNPVRIIIDPRLTLGQGFHVFDNRSRTLVYNLVKHAKGNPVEYIKLGNRKRMITSMLEHLYEENIQSVLVEGGAHTLQAFIENDTWDEARIFTGMRSLEEGLPAPVLHGHLRETHNIAGDMLRIFAHPGTFR